MDYQFKFSEKDARLFYVNENTYYLSLFDVMAVSNFYDTDISTSIEKIAESHNIPYGDIELVNEAELAQKVSYNATGLDRHISKIKDEIETTEDQLKVSGILPDKKRLLQEKLRRLKNNLTSFNNQKAQYA